MIRRCLPFVLALALSACGFHLRNALVLPGDLGPVQVRSADRYSPLAASLERAVERAGAQIAEAGDPDASVLDLLSERWGDTPIAVDQLGRAQEFSLRYAVVFEVRRPDGSKPVPRQAVELSRDYISNPVKALGTEGEREILMHELRREMAAAILRRIAAVAGSGMPIAQSDLDEPVAEDAARAALEAADANPPPPAEPSSMDTAPEAAGVLPAADTVAPPEPSLQPR